MTNFAAYLADCDRTAEAVKREREETAKRNEQINDFRNGRCYGCKKPYDGMGGFCVDCLGNNKPRSTNALMEGYRE